MGKLRFIELDGLRTIVNLPAVSIDDKRTPEQKEKDREVTYGKRNSFISKFITKFDVLKNTSEFVYIYLRFDDIISCEIPQKCIKIICGEEEPRYQMVSEDEKDVILKVESKKFDKSEFYYHGKIKSNFDFLLEFRILSAKNYSEAFSEVEKKQVDNFDCKKIVIVLRDIKDTEDCFSSLVKLGLFSELRLIKELGVLFGELKDSKGIIVVREQFFVVYACLRNMEDIDPDEYVKTIGKTKQKLSVKYDEQKLIGKPSVCIIDSGVSELFLIKTKGELPYLNKKTLDHGTQVASLVVSADNLVKGEDLEQKYNIISYRICDGQKENVLEGVTNAIKSYYNQCKLFVLSYNFYEKLEPILLLYLSRRLDYFLHKMDVILLVPSGNNCDETIKDAIKHNYLDKNPILFPSNCKNVFSIGGLLEYDSVIRTIAPYTRYLPHFADLEHEGEEYFILKPNLYVFGGGESKDKKKINYLPTMSQDGYLVNHFGTSFANGLLGHMFLRLIEQYPKINYSETYKALMLASGKMDSIIQGSGGRTNISISSIGEFEAENKGVILFHEDVNSLGVYRPYRDTDKKLKQKSEEFKLFINAEKIEKVQVFLVHSNGYIKNPYSKSLIYFNASLKSPRDNKNLSAKNSMFGDLARWSTFGKCTPIQIAEFKLGIKTKTIQSQIGEYVLNIMPKRKNIPHSEDNVAIRWGVVIKLIPRLSYSNKVEEIYDEIMEKTKGIVKIKEETSLLVGTEEIHA